MALADELGSGGPRVGALGTLARIAIRRNDVASALSWTEAAVAIVREHGPQWGSVPWVPLLEARGDVEEAARRLAVAWEDAGRRGVAESQLGIGPELVRLALANGSRAYAEAVTEVLETLAQRAQVPVADGGALLSRGRLSGDPDTLLGAVEAYRRGQRAPARADATEVAAAALVRANRTSEALALFDEALATLESLEAHRDIARVTATMRSLGIRRGSRAAHRRATSGWPALTDSERRIVALVAEGLTNPEIGRRLFISPRTVQTHLAHVFTKLGISSRVDLAAQAVSHRVSSR